MSRWQLITHNLHAFQLVTSRLASLGVEFYAPTKLELKKRRDCNAVRVNETQLFPGYLFLRMNIEQVHTSTVSDIPGVKDFVRFGVDISTVSNSLIEALKYSLLLQMQQTDKKVASIECRNVSPAVMSALSEIVLMKCKIERQTALFSLLKNDAQLVHMGSRPFSRITSVIEKPQVNEKIW